ncbi:Glycosyl hydrolase family 53 [Balamuthia mandrillaris]
MEKRGGLFLLGLATVVLFLLPCHDTVTAQPSSTASKLPQSGFTFTNGKYCPNVTYASPISKASLYHLATTGANWVALVVTQYQRTHNSTQIFPLYTPQHSDRPPWYYTFVTATEEELSDAIHQAHALGLRVMLKPHVDLTEDPDPGMWRGDIGRGFTEEQWAEWFRSYEQFLMPYVRLAARTGVEQFSLSCELIEASKQDAHWRQLIAKVRDSYSGTLTDSANWGWPNATGGEITNKTWWDAVDIIGVDEYYHLLPEVPNPTVEQLEAAWIPIIEQLRKVSQRFDSKPVVFTEIGYCSGLCQRGRRPSSSDLRQQAVHYEAALRVMMKESSWILGAFWWNWPTDAAFGGYSDDCMAQAYKPVEDVLRKYYQATLPVPPPPSYPPSCLCTL